MCTNFKRVWWLLHQIKPQKAPVDSDIYSNIRESFLTIFIILTTFSGVQGRQGYLMARGVKKGSKSWHR